MKRRYWVGLGFVATLVVLFVLTPAVKVDPGIGKFPEIDWKRGIVDTRPQKSPLRMSIEGRLHWLGVL